MLHSIIRTYTLPSQQRAHVPFLFLHFLGNIESSLLCSFCTQLAINKVRSGRHSHEATKLNVPTIYTHSYLSKFLLNRLLSSFIKQIKCELPLTPRNGMKKHTPLALQQPIGLARFSGNKFTRTFSRLYYIYSYFICASQ